VKRTKAENRWAE